MVLPDATWPRALQLFYESVDLAPEARAPLVARIREEEPAVAERLERLLAEHEHGGPLDRPAVVVDGEPAETPLEPGSLLAGRFEIVRVIAQGGIGHVYEARDRELGTTVALKTLRRRLARDARARERFRREVLLARRVTHHNACRLFDAGQDGDLDFLTMELLEGVTLAARLERDGALAADEALAVAEQVAGALDYAHGAGVVHRDLKSGNVMLIDGPPSSRAVVTDFGLAKAAGDEVAASLLAGVSPDERLTLAGQIVGTPAVMAPEQLGGGQVTAASDLWAFGILLHEMRTGRLPEVERSGPVGVPTATALSPQLEPAWRAAIAACLQIDPLLRPRSAREVVERIAGVATVSGHRRRRIAAMAAAIVGLLLLVLAAGIWLQPRPEAATSADEAAAGIEPSTAGGSATAADRGFVLVTDWENRTGEELFDGTAEAILSRELAGSGPIRVAPRPRVDDALRLMKRPLDTTIDRELGRELAARDEGIRALVTGTVDKVDGHYAFAAEVVRPDTGVTEAVLTDSAASEAEVFLALARLARGVRRSLGESVRSLDPPPGRHARVTTPSLGAFQLYTRADEMMMEGGDRSVPARLLREAIAEDPDFASAYTHLAWCVPDPEERLALSRRALELAPGASPAERLFIEGSDHAFRGDREAALKSFEAVLRFDPDHWWAINNVINRTSDASSGPGSASAEWAYHLAALQPNNAPANSRAATTSLWLGRLDEAARYAEAARRVAAVKSGDWDFFLYQYLPHHVDWVRGDVDAVLGRLELEPPPVIGTQGLEILLSARVGWHLTLGRPAEALAILDRSAASETRRFYQGLIAGYRGDVAGMVSAFEQPFPDIGGGMIREAAAAAILARAGFLERARAGVEHLTANHQESYARVAEGSIALTEGDLPRTIAILDPLLTGGWIVLPGGTHPEGDPVFHWGALTLAEARRLEGRPDLAVEILEARRAARVATHSWGRLPWMEEQVALARLYRRLGRDREAAAIESEIRGLLRLAEPDFFLLRELDDRAAETLLIPSFPERSPGA